MAWASRSEQRAKTRAGAHDANVLETRIVESIEIGQVHHLHSSYESHEAYRPGRGRKRLPDPRDGCPDARSVAQHRDEVGPRRPSPVSGDFGWTPPLRHGCHRGSSCCASPGSDGAERGGDGAAGSRAGSRPGLRPAPVVAPGEARPEGPTPGSSTPLDLLRLVGLGLAALAAVGGDDERVDTPEAFPLRLGSPLPS